MKVGDLVKNKKTGKIGKVLEISKVTPGVMVDLSDASGVMVRCAHRDNLEVIDEAD